MELIPKALVAGVFVQGQVVSTGPASIVLQQAGKPAGRDAINRIWSDVVTKYSTYQSLQFDPTGQNGIFIGSGPEDVVLIQPPLLQVRDIVGELGLRQSAEKAEFVFRTAVHHIGGPVPASLGVKLVYNAPSPAHNSIDFLLSEMVAGGDDIKSLAGAMSYEASVKYVLRGTDVAYTLLVEPLHSDPSLLYIDLDAQFPGVVDVTRISERIQAVESFLSTQVRSFLERRAEGWAK